MVEEVADFLVLLVHVHTIVELLEDNHVVAVLFVGIEVFVDVDATTEDDFPMGVGADATVMQVGVGLVEELHLATLQSSLRHLLIRIERALDDRARLHVLDLRADESRALARLDMLELDDGPQLAVVLDAHAVLEICSRNCHG